MRFPITALQFCLLLASAGSLMGQGATATIFGTVSDSTGAPVAGAQITATNVETNVARKGSTGAFRSRRSGIIPELSAGATTQNVDQRRPYLPGTLGSIVMADSILNSLDRGRANNDRTHSFVVSAIWALDYLHSAPKWARAIAGGWSLSAISTMRSGTPLTITSGVDHNLDGNNNDRADLNGNPVLDPNRSRSDVVAKWFDTTMFTQPKDGSDGTAGRNIIDGPGLENMDLGIFRQFHPREHWKLMFRGEATNAFNLVNLLNPGTNLNSGSTFGKITTANAMRQVQLGLRLTF